VKAGSGFQSGGACRGEGDVAFAGEKDPLAIGKDEGASGNGFADPFGLTGGRIDAGELVVTASFFVAGEKVAIEWDGGIEEECETSGKSIVILS
jgi:hypothetical protein